MRSQVCFTKFFCTSLKTSSHHSQCVLNAGHCNLKKKNSTHVLLTQALTQNFRAAIITCKNHIVLLCLSIPVEESVDSAKWLQSNSTPPIRHLTQHLQWHRLHTMSRSVITSVTNCCFRTKIARSPGAFSNATVFVYIHHIHDLWLNSMHQSFLVCVLALFPTCLAAFPLKFAVWPCVMVAVLTSRCCATGTLRLLVKSAHTCHLTKSLIMKAVAITL